MRRIAALGLALTLGTTTLVGCSDNAKYCTELAKSAPVVAEVAGNVAQLKAEEAKKLLDSSKKLQEAAPSEVEDDWKTLNDFAEKVVAAKDDAAKLAALRDRLPAVRTAAEAIRTNAGDTCNVSLN